jgi:hypothetical protein
MSGPSRRASAAPGRAGLALLGALSLAVPGAPRAAGLMTSCHIHPPPDLVERGEQPGTIGPYPSGEACEAARLTLFGALGRCHCVQSFAAGPWSGGARGSGSRDLPDTARDLAPPLP